MLDPGIGVGTGVPEGVGTGVTEGVRENGTGVGVADNDEDDEVTDGVVAGVVVSANPESISRFSSSAALRKKGDGMEGLSRTHQGPRSFANKKPRPDEPPVRERCERKEGTYLVFDFSMRIRRLFSSLFFAAAILSISEELPETSSNHFFCFACFCSSVSGMGTGGGCITSTLGVGTGATIGMAFGRRIGVGVASCTEASMVVDDVAGSREDSEDSEEDDDAETVWMDSAMKEAARSSNVTVADSVLTATSASWP